MVEQNPKLLINGKIRRSIRRSLSVDMPHFCKVSEQVSLYLLSIFNPPVTTNEAIVSACMAGYLELVQELYYRTNKSLPKAAYTWACLNKHHKLIRWIEEQKWECRSHYDNYKYTVHIGQKLDCSFFITKYQQLLKSVFMPEIIRLDCLENYDD